MNHAQRYVNELIWKNEKLNECNEWMKNRWMNAIEIQWIEMNESNIISFRWFNDNERMNNELYKIDFQNVNTTQIC